MPRLSETERALFSALYKIIEVLLPEEASNYRIDRTAIESGYEGFYFAKTFPFDQPLPPEQTSEVLSILEMHRVLFFSYRRLEDKGSLRPEDIEFRGWDGNYENELLVFTRWFCDEQDSKGFTELERNSRISCCTDLNGAGNQLPRYRAMLNVYQTVKNSGSMYLTLENIQRIIAAGV